MSRLSSTHGWPRAAVFDCDGLLVDSAGCWERAYARLAQAHDRPLNGLDRTALAGASVAGAAAILGPHLGITVDERQLRRLLVESFAAAPPRAMAGARWLVTTLAARIPVGVASNAPLEIVDTILRQLELRALLGAVVSAEQTAAHKPAPDVYVEACRRLGVAPSDAIAFEDSPAGARAARAAGLVVVAVPSAPRLAIDADLRVSRLDHPQLIAYLGLGAAR